MTVSLTYKTVPRRSTPQPRALGERLVSNPGKHAQHQFWNRRVTHSYRLHTRRTRSTIPPIDHQFTDQHPPSSTDDFGSNWSTNSEKMVEGWVTGIAERAVRRKRTTRDMDDSPEATPTTDAHSSEVGRATRDDRGVTTHSMLIPGSKKSRSGGISA